MGARADLIATAEGLASAARRSVGDGGSMTGADVAAGYATAAKAALEAAALANDVGPGEIDQALSGIQELLEEAGVFVESIEMDTTEFLSTAFRALIAWRAEALAAQAYEVAYGGLKTLSEGLERDFIVGDTDTSRRIAARIRSALDDAEHIIKTNGGTDGQDPEG